MMSQPIPSYVPQTLNGVTAHPSKQLRVLFINDTSRNGGPGRTLFYILKFLNPEVIHRAVIVPREGVVTELLRDGRVADHLALEPKLVENIVEPFSRAIQREDFEAPLALRGLRAVGNVFRGATGLFNIVQRVRKERFDAVFCNGTTANFVGGAIAAWTNVPVVWHVFYTSVAPAIQSLHAKLAAGANVRSILCVSKPTTRLFGHCMDKVRVVHDAIDVEEFDATQKVAPELRTSLGLGPDTVIFGSQGRILPRKGYIEMVRAAKMAVDSLTREERARCRFVVLGDTPEDMTPNHLEECRALVEELGLTGTFHFLGYKPDVKPYVADFDATVVPSVYEDPLPRAVMESMAMSKPVIAFAMGGIGEMIDDGVSGALVRGAPPDIKGLAQAFVRYFRDPAMRKSHGEAARRRVERDFEAKGHARAIEDELLRVARRS